MKFVVFSPDVYTGGIFALLQLNQALTDFGVPSEVLFFDKAEIKPGEAQKTYTTSYLSPVTLQVSGLTYKICEQFGPEDILIIPESRPDIASEFHARGHPGLVFWWLSWDNAPLGKLKQFDCIKCLNNCLHIFQSDYARREANRLGFDGPMVSDYTIFDEKSLFVDMKKSNDICYLERKAPGSEDVISELSAKFSIIKINNMQQSQVQDTLRSSKFFIDFGSHPGKDRIPREAAVFDCVPIYRKIGAAKIFQDVPVPDYLKLDSSVMADPVSLMRVLDNLDANMSHVRKAIEPYKRRIMNEKLVFYEEVKEFIEANFGIILQA